jgi:hypothetical protein
MGDWFQTVVVKDAEEKDASKLASAIHEWLVQEGIVMPEPSDCLFGSDTGFAPGPNYTKAVEEPYDLLRDLCSNGLELVTKRTVFHAGQCGLSFICPVCSRRVEGDGDGFPVEKAEWDAAVMEWYQKSGPGMLKCMDCGNTAPVADWQYDPPWAFADLGFTFWNWPTLKNEFVSEVGRRLGHRVVLVSGKA